MSLNTGSGSGLTKCILCCSALYGMGPHRERKRKQCYYSRLRDFQGVFSDGTVSSLSTGRRGSILDFPEFMSPDQQALRCQIVNNHFFLRLSFGSSVDVSSLRMAAASVIFFKATKAARLRPRPEVAASPGPAMVLLDTDIDA